MTSAIQGNAVAAPAHLVEDAFVAFQNLTPDGFVMFRPVRAENGGITDLEWTFVNTAAARIIGKPADYLVGRRLLEVMPENRDEGLFDAYVAVIETGELWQREFHYDHGGITAWFRATAARSGEGLAISFADITEVRKGDERRQTLIDSVIAFVGVLSTDGVLLEANKPALAAAGLPRNAVIGVPFWDTYWWSHEPATQERLKQAVASAAGGDRVRYDVEIRVAGDRRIWIDFQLEPVFDRTGTVTELIPSGVDITDRKQAEAHRELLINELSHRVKNTLATIQSMARQSTRSATSMETFRDAFDARLQSIAASHDLLVASRHQSAPLMALVEGQVMPYTAEPARLVLEGDDILLPGDVAHTLGLVLHELAANASKYGALSNDTGTVTVSWQVAETAGGRVLNMAWSERGGPPFAPPTRQGFGTRLIERTLTAANDGATIDYAPHGVTCRLTMALA